MKVTFAQFNVEHDEKSYGVQMGVQYVTQNTTYTTVTIYAVTDGVKRILRNFSTSGRQVISPSNAKKFLRDALIAEGTIKAPKPKEDPAYKPGDAAVHEGKVYKALDPPSLFDLKTSPGQETPNDNRIPDPVPHGVLKRIRKLFFS